MLLKYLLDEYHPVVEDAELSGLGDLSFEDWQTRISKYRSMIIVAPGKVRLLSSPILIHNRNTHL